VHKLATTTTTTTTTTVLWCCWLGSRKGIHPVKKTEWWDADMVMCLGQGADLHMAQAVATTILVPCSSKSRLVLSFSYRFTRVVPDKGVLNGCCWN